MREITKIMYKKYALNKLKYDFMGYEFQRPEQLSFHHLIVPHRLCKAKGLGEGYLEWNGAILRCFEREYCGVRSKKGHPIVREEYTRRLLKK